jgi:hypothetical protein
MDPNKLRPGEILAAVAGVVLAISLFLPAFSPNPDNKHAEVAGSHTDVSIWADSKILSIIFLAAAVAPIVLVYIIIRRHKLSWPRGEMTAVIGLIASTLLVYIGIISRPGDPSGEIGLAYGWFIALAAAILVALGGAVRSSEVERERKPPGVL